MRGSVAQRHRRFILGMACLLGLALPVRAQAIDPAVLESVQAALGAAQSASRTAERVSQEASDGGGTTQVIAPPGGKIDTEEEQEVRRAQARRQLQSLYQPTEIGRASCRERV